MRPQMDYKFFTDASGKVIAQCDEDGAAFGDWLSNELYTATAVEAVLEIIQQLELGTIKAHKMKGQDYTLVLDEDEAQLHRHLGYWDEDAELPEGTELDMQDEVGCGLQDLKELLQDWLEFIDSK